MTLSIRACLAIALFAAPASVSAQTKADVVPHLLTAPMPEPKTVALKASRASAPPDWSLKASVHFVPSGSNVPAPERLYVPEFSLEDNAGAGVPDLDSNRGKIRSEIPQPLADFGIYYVKVSECRAYPQIVYEPRSPGSWFDRLLRYLGEIGDGLLASDAVSPQWTPTNPQQFVRPPRDDLWVASIGEEGQPLQDARRVLEQAQTPTWSPRGNLMVCSVWRETGWRLAGLQAQAGDVSPQIAWEWHTEEPASTDTNPVFVTSERRIAYLRTQGDKSDVWLLSLNEDGQPTEERRLTQLENVSRVVMWSDATGLLIETPLRLEGDKTIIPVLAQVDVESGLEKPPLVAASPLPGSLLAGFVPARQEFVVEAFRLGLDQPNQLVTFGKAREIRSLQSDGYWPRVAPDGTHIAFTRRRQ